MRETRVEKHLVKGIEAMDGLCRKVVYPAHKGAPDRLILLGFLPPHEVETKAPGKDAEDHQRREHLRHCARNMPVYVLDTIAKVDIHLARLWVLRNHPYRVEHKKWWEYLRNGA